MITIGLDIGARFFFSIMGLILLSASSCSNGSMVKEEMLNWYSENESYTSLYHDSMIDVLVRYVPNEIVVLRNFEEGMTMESYYETLEMKKSERTYLVQLTSLQDKYLIGLDLERSKETFLNSIEAGENDVWVRPMASLVESDGRPVDQVLRVNLAFERAAGSAKGLRFRHPKTEELLFFSFDAEEAGTIPKLKF